MSRCDCQEPAGNSVQGEIFRACAPEGVPQQGEGVQVEALAQAWAGLWRVQGVFGEGCSVTAGREQRRQRRAPGAIGWGFKGERQVTYGVLKLHSILK